MQAAAILRLQRAAAALGLTPVDVIPPPHDSRLDEMETRSSRLVEGDNLAWHQVGEAEPWGEPVAFLDGIQRYGIFAYDGCSPVAWAMVAAAVRERRDRRFRSAAAARRELVIGRRETLDRLAEIVGERGPAPIPDDVPPHPLREMQAIRRVVDTVRGQLEVEVGSAYRRTADGWLLVDGSLGVRPAWGRDPRMMGVVKSHASLPFEGETLARYLRLPQGHRSSVFAPESSVVVPVFSWALRLWNPDHKDLFHGLIRLEVPPTERSVEEAPAIARHLMAERSPLSTPDRRWDRLLYGFHDVEMFLKAGGGGGAPNMAPVLTLQS